MFAFLQRRWQRPAAASFARTRTKPKHSTSKYGMSERGGGGAEQEEEESPQPRLMLSRPSLPSRLTSPGSDREEILHGHHYDHQLCACGRGSSCRSPRGGVQQQLIPRMRPRPTRTRRTDPSHRSGAAEEFVVAVTANYMVLRSLSLSLSRLLPTHDKRDGFGDRLCLECREGGHAKLSIRLGKTSKREVA